MERGLLEGRSAFVTGGAQGIGLAIARAFLEHGARVTVADVSTDALQAGRAALEGLGPVRAVRLDVTDLAATEAAAAAAEAEQGGIGIVVPNAGVLVLKPAVDLSLGEWRRVIDTNLTGAFVTATVFARRMIAGGRGGRIILTSSLFGLRGGAGNGAYSASKFGVVGLMQSLAAELAPHGILANCVCPGQIQTAMLDSLFEERAAAQGTQAAELKADFERRIPLRRLGAREEVADAYFYLASDLSRYVTGQSLVVDGGWQVG
jgi:NAD(P)-dependent dehydrogenase (short-subunit alcohol dehydrogenase family)